MWGKLIMRAVFVLLILLLLMPFMAAKPAELDDARALDGVETGAVIWDITLYEPLTLIEQLNLIGQTHADLLRQGVEPSMVLVFREGTVRFLDRELSQVDFAIAADAEEFQQSLLALTDLPGVRVEACGISMRGHGVAVDKLLPGIAPVGNTFVSVIAYGQKGYVPIPIH